jgi:hypothetical protein
MDETKTAISKAASYQEVGEYWDTHDLAAHWEETREVTFDVDLPRETSAEPT